MRSSYIDNNYGELFKALVKMYQPKAVVEFGCLDGYSSSFILQGLKENGQSFNFKVFDLFEDYPYKHGNFTELKNQFPEIEFQKADYYKSSNMFSDNSIDFLHIDVSNTSESYETFINEYYSKLKTKGIAILEGGSNERDLCEWMVKYEKPKINSFLKTLQGKFNFIVLEPFPSVTIFTK